jgi:hypothetical protein
MGEAKKLWDTVLANRKKLDDCVGPHDFSKDLTPTQTLLKRWECTKCGGSVDSHAKHWYDAGLLDGQV